MSTSRWLIKSSVVLIALLVVTDGQGVKWVPIVERRPEAANEIEAVFQNTWHKDRITTEKVERISKMLNNSLDAQEQEMKEGRQKLNELQQSNSASTCLVSFGLMLISLLMTH